MSSSAGSEIPVVAETPVSSDSMAEATVVGLVAASQPEIRLDISNLKSNSHEASVIEAVNRVTITEHAQEHESASIDIVEADQDDKNQIDETLESDEEEIAVAQNVVPQSPGIPIEEKPLRQQHTPNRRSVSCRSNPFDHVTTLPGNARKDKKMLERLEESIFGPPTLSTPQAPIVNTDTVSASASTSRQRHQRSASCNTNLPSSQNDEFFARIFRDEYRPAPTAPSAASQSASSVSSDMDTNHALDAPTNVVPPSPQHSETSHINSTIHAPKLKMVTSDVSNVSQTASHADSLSASNHARSISLDSQGHQAMLSASRPKDASNAQALMLGLEQLERQQAEHEARQKSQVNDSNNPHSYLPSTIHVSSNPQQDYARTNSAMPPVYHQPPTTWVPGNGYGVNSPHTGAYDNAVGNRLNPQPMHPHQAPQAPDYLQRIPVLNKDKEKATRSFRKLQLAPLFHYYSNSNKQKNADLESPQNPIMEENENDERLANNSQAIIYGYLHKLNQSGKWQRRFFETDGQCLTYYKTSKRVKLLATLDLIKVGQIAVTEDDTSGCTFQIQVAERPYFLKAENNGICQDWVINLNRVREARFQLGGMKLVAPDPLFQPYPECEERDAVDRQRSESSSDMVARVTVEANRMRSKRVTGITEYWSNLDKANHDDAVKSPVVLHHHLLGWQKRRRNFQIIRSKLASFVRWMKHIKHIARQNNNSIDEAQADTPFAPTRYNDPNGVLYRHEEATVEESELSSGQTAQSLQDSSSIGANSSFDPSRPRLGLQKSTSGGSSIISNPSMRETENPSDPSPKFGHTNLSFEKSDYQQEEVEDGGILS